MQSRWSAAAFLLAAFAGIGFSKADNSKLHVGDASIVPGESVEVSIAMEDAEGIGALDLRLSYDADMLTFVDIDTGSSAANAMVDANEAAPGELVIAVVDGDGFAGDGEILRVRFRADADAEGSTDVQVKHVAAHHAKKLTAIPVEAVGGRVTFSAAPAHAEPIETGGSVQQAESDAKWLWLIPIAAVFALGVLWGRRRAPAAQRQPQAR